MRGGLPKCSEKIEAVKRRLSAHNELEESMVYSLPAHLLDETELEDLKQAVQRELENLPPRYARGGEID
jgi:hemerythrin superfamily protein